MKSIKERCEEMAFNSGHEYGFEYLYEFNRTLGHEIELKATKDYYEERIASYPIDGGQITALIDRVHENAKSKGFYDPDTSENISEKLMLIVSEIAEAQEADRKGRRSVCGSITNALLTEDFEIAFRHHIKDTFEDELSDAVIRIFDLAGWLKIDLEWHIHQKIRYNSTREKMHGKKY